MIRFVATLLSIQIPPVVEKLINDQALENYGSGRSNSIQRSQIENISLEDLFPEGVANRQMADCCLSGIWILHNFLDESHSISQQIHSAEGSFWHAIMHRLEGDFSNSKYWYRQVGQHPVFQTIETEIASDWDPENFVDRCQSESRQGKLSEATRRLALQEWKSLFEFCFLGAKR